MRKILKAVIYSIAYLLVLPGGVVSVLCKKACGSQFFFEICTHSLSLVPGWPGVPLRACYYQQTLKKAPFDLAVYFGGRITRMEAEFGHNVIVAAYATVGLVKAGDNVAIGNHVNILSGRRHHNFETVGDTIFTGEDRFEAINLGKSCFIGDNSVVMADIGAYSLVGAGSVVVKPVPEYVVAVGNPAKVVKKRPRPGHSGNSES